MARVVLHIGTHKTGSTAVQAALAANRRLLSAQGVHYPELARGQPAHHGLAAVWNDQLRRLEPRGGALAAWRAIARSYAAKDGTLILSSEELGRAIGPRRVDYGFILEALGAFERVEVVGLLRDQVSFLQSAYLEIAKITPHKPADGGALRSWESFHRAAVEDGAVMGLRLNHSARHRDLASVFGEENVHLADYAQARRHPHGALGVVLERAGCAVDPASLALPDGGRANVTDDPLSVWVAAQVAAPNRPGKALVDAVMPIVRERFGSKTTLYTPDEIRAVEERFAPTNRRLARRVAGLELAWPDLSGADTRDRLDAEFWIAVARRVHAAA